MIIIRFREKIIQNCFQKFKQILTHMMRLNTFGNTSSSNLCNNLGINSLTEFKEVYPNFLIRLGLRLQILYLTFGMLLPATNIIPKVEDDSVYMSYSRTSLVKLLVCNSTVYVFSRVYHKL